ncbi:MAG: BRO family protein [Methylococcaceae bacterium]
MNTLTLTFQNTSFDIVDHNNQPWLRSPQIGDALGYVKGRISIDKIYKSNADEFTDTMTALVELDTEGGKQQVRVFSLRGCHLLAMLSRTKIAKEFRKWVLDILDHGKPEEFAQLPEPKTKQALTGGLTLDQQDTIKALVKSRAEDLPKDKQAGAIIKQWSAIKKKFGCTYKEVSPDNFVNIISLITRLPVEGELLPKESALPHDAITLRTIDGLRYLSIIFEGCVGTKVNYNVSINQQFVSISKVDEENDDKIIAAMKDKGYIVVKKTDVISKLQA